MGQVCRNLEVKVACSRGELARRRELLTANGIPIVARLRQRDVYLRVPNGRRKLRSITEERDGAPRTWAELITYTRPDETASRWSDYSIVPVDLNEVGTVEEALVATHGILAVVVKRRDLALWGATRVHLDEVEDLGCFIELETVLTDQSETEARQEHEAVIRSLKLDELPVVAGSYSDLLLRKSPDAHDAGVNERD